VEEKVKIVDLKVGAKPPFNVQVEIIEIVVNDQKVE